MKTEEKLEEITDVILRTLREDFENINILEAKVHSDVDSDGEDILRVEVVFEGKPRDLAASGLSGAVRHVRPKLSEINVPDFPLFSFISSKELKRSNLGRGMRFAAS